MPPDCLPGGWAWWAPFSGRPRARNRNPVMDRGNAWNRGTEELSRSGRPAVSTREDFHTVATDSFAPTRKERAGTDTPAPAVTGLSPAFQRRYLPEACQFTAGSVDLRPVSQVRSRRSLALARCSRVSAADWSDEFLGTPLRSSRPREMRPASPPAWLESLRVVGAPPMERGTAEGYQEAAAGQNQRPVRKRAELWRKLENGEISATEFLRGRKRLGAEGGKAVWRLPARQRAEPPNCKQHATARY